MTPKFLRSCAVCQPARAAAGREARALVDQDGVHGPDVAGPAVAAGVADREVEAAPLGRRGEALVVALLARLVDHLVEEDPRHAGVKVAPARHVRLDVGRGARAVRREDVPDHLHARGGELRNAGHVIGERCRPRTVVRVDDGEDRHRRVGAFRGRDRVPGSTARCAVKAERSSRCRRPRERQERRPVPRRRAQPSRRAKPERRPQEPSCRPPWSSSIRSRCRHSRSHRPPRSGLVSRRARGRSRCRCR